MTARIQFWSVACLAIASAAVAGSSLHVIRVSGVSMEYTYHNGQLLGVLTNSHVASPVIQHLLTRNRVIVLRDPAVHGQLLVKRIVAVGGDTVAVQGGTLYVNGQSSEIATRKPSPRSSWGLFAATSTGVLIPKDTFFVLSDNIGVVGDSRLFGSVGGDAIIGVVIIAL
jgi:signal peptidase I